MTEADDPSTMRPPVAGEGGGSITTGRGLPA